MPKPNSGPMSEASQELLEDVRKGKSRKFLMICKGTQIVSLVVFKKGNAKKYEKEAKRAGSGSVYFGVVEGRGANLNFKLARTDGFEKEPTKTQTLKEFLNENTDQSYKPQFEIVDVAPIVIDEDDPATEKIDELDAPLASPDGTKPITEGPPVSTPPEPPPLPNSDAGTILAALVAVLKKAAPYAPTLGADVKQAALQVRELVNAAGYDEARQKLAQIAQRIKEAGETAGQAVASERREEFKHRLTELKAELDRLRSGASDGDRLRAGEASALARQAGGHAQKGAFAEAFGLLTRAAALCQKPSDDRVADGAKVLAPDKVIRFAAIDAQIPPPAQPGPMFGLGRPRSGAVISPKRPTAPPLAVKGANGRKMEVVRTTEGRVTLLAPPPPVHEITFSGGGGKGAALPGAVRALEKSGVLKDVKVITGASVGSMTAALVAAGITAEEFEEIGNDPSISAQIKQGKNMAQVMFGGGISGAGLEKLVREKMNNVVRSRIMEYIEQESLAGRPVNAEAVAIGKKLATGKIGPTFGDLRTLSKVIPSVKEVIVNASFMAEVDPETGQPRKGGRAQMAVFSADTEPDLEVALAVHASASLPPVFNPVDIPLASGITARFQDGGVLNNAPTTDSIGAERNLDPIPEKGGMTFVFEEEAAQEILNGVAVPRANKLGDWLTGANHAAAEYAKNRDLADRPEDVVMVPLSFTVPSRTKGKKGSKRDFSGLLSGTTNFDMQLEDKLKLQELADEATTAHILKKQEPQARDFASIEQMLICIPRADLRVLATDGFDGAKEALQFRDTVTDTVTALTARAQALSDRSGAAIVQDRSVKDAFGLLERLSSDNADRHGFVARELNRSGKLDALLASVRKNGDPSSDMLEASYAVNDAVKAKAHAKTILRDMIYPKMVKQDPKGAGGEVLSQVDAILRAATSPEDVNDALRIAINHFTNKSDLLGRHGHKQFATELSGYLMKIT